MFFLICQLLSNLNIVLISYEPGEVFLAHTGCTISENVEIVHPSTELSHDEHSISELICHIPL